MRSIWFGFVAIVCGGTLPLAAQQAASQSVAPQSAAPRPAAEQPANADAAEQVVAAAVQAYVQAYNRHDAHAVAELFAPEAQLIDATGHAIQGRKAIEEVFAEVFSEYPQATTSVVVKAVRVLNANLVMEEGTANTTLVPGEAAEPTDYSVIHVKQDGRWLMASARDLDSDTAPAADRLKQLDWLVGSWVDESPDSLVLTNYHWDESGNFLLGDFTVTVAGQQVLRGTQRIGWDPQAKNLRSWVFDAEGGFAEGVYARDGNRWIIKMTGVTHDGRPASSTNIITRVGRDRMRWESRDRVVGGQPQPDLGDVTVVRTPPKPM